jgi:hypothetical protein
VIVVDTGVLYADIDAGHLWAEGTDRPFAAAWLDLIVIHS